MRYQLAFVHNLTGSTSVDVLRMTQTISLTPIQGKGIVPAGKRVGFGGAWHY
jgi:hypothetical protein